MAKIEDALPYVLKNEGGYSNDPRDPGGATNWGITIAELSDWRGHRCTPMDVRNLSLTEACAIYKAHYWDLLHLDMESNQAIATAIFDVAVNRGVGVARQYNREILAQLPSGWGPAAYIELFEKRVEQGYRNIVAHKPRLGVFLKGWLNRARRLLTLLKG